GGRRHQPHLQPHRCAGFLPSGLASCERHDPDRKADQDPDLARRTLCGVSGQDRQDSRRRRYAAGSRHVPVRLEHVQQRPAQRTPAPDPPGRRRKRHPPWRPAHRAGPADTDRQSSSKHSGEDGRGTELVRRQQRHHCRVVMIDRRQVLTGVIGGLLGSALLPRRSAAQQTGVAQQTGLVALNDRLSLVTSGGTNVIALSTADGIVIVDSGTPELVDSLMGSLRQLSAGRVATVFNTHWHVENTGANEVLRRGGATIVAHENTRLWMATPTWIPAEDRYRPARP